MSRVTLSRLREDHRIYSAAFLKIPTKAAGMQSFHWNRPQQMLAAAVARQEAAGRPVRVVVLKSRQVGISTWIQSYLNHRCHMRPHRTAITLAHKEDSALNLFEMQRRYYECMPSDEAHPLYAPRRYFTRRQIQWKNGSRSQVTVVGKGAGRSFTSQYIHVSELAFYENAEDTLQALKQAVPKIPDSAVFIESTPKGSGNAFHRVYRRAKSGKSSYAAVFIAWYDDPTCRMAADFGEEDLDEAERELLQLYPGRVDLEALAWRRSAIADECDGDVERFLEEYPSDDVSCFLTSGRPVFDKAGLLYQQAALPEDPMEGISCNEIEVGERGTIELRGQRNGRIYILEGPKPRRRYILGTDPSEGDPGSTASPIAVFDQFSFTFPALWYGRTPPDLLAEHAMKLGALYNDGFQIWEANNHGNTFGLRMRDLGCGNFYMRKTHEDSIAGEITDKPGYWTSTKARHDLINTYRKFVREAPQKGWPPIRHPMMVEEIAALQYEEDKIVAGDGSLMDTVIAAALCLFAHRGNMDTPLEPLSEELIQRLYGEIGWKLQMGIIPHDAELEPYHLTAEELERLDDLVHNREEASKRKGLGGMT